MNPKVPESGLKNAICLIYTAGLNPRNRICFGLQANLDQAKAHLSISSLTIIAYGNFLLLMKEILLWLLITYGRRVPPLSKET